MAEYKPNSHKYREEQKARAEDRKIEKVVTGVSSVKKKNGLQKVANVFISEDAGNIKDYIINDMVVPTVKKTIVGVVDMLLNGGRSTYSDRFSGGSKVSYRKFYDDRRDDRPATSSSGRGRFDFDDIEYTTRGDAERVLDEMFDVLDHYKIVSVADMYEMAGLQQPYTSNKYGWTNLRGAHVDRIGGKYYINLPKAMPID